MKLIDLTPGVRVSFPHSEERTVERVIMHPSGPTVRFEGSPWVRRHYSYAELQKAGAEVVS